MRGRMVDLCSPSSRKYDLAISVALGKQSDSIVVDTERTGLPLSSIHAPIDEAVAKGWLQRDGGWVRPTVRGYDLLNDVLELFLPAN